MKCEKGKVKATFGKAKKAKRRNEIQMRQRKGKGVIRLKKNNGNAQ